MAYSGAAYDYDFALFEPRRSYVGESDRDVSGRKKGSGSRTGTSKSRTGSKTSKAKTVSEQERKRLARAAKKAHEKRVKTGLYALAGVAAALLITFMVAGGVQQHEYTQRIDDANAVLNELNNDYEALRVEYETRLGASAVEEYAVNNIGMQKVQNSQITWVTVEKGDVFEVAKPTRGIFSTSSLNDLLSYLA
ncbi:MAG: hypothetical protein IJP10_02520 [Clostridia bacterium]|nr:hypothetical protein [Oscillospiraceae bacterium]MBQ6796867.1 hypothetical protein [Clostridia bacterium]